MEETSSIGFKEAASIARQFVLDIYEEGPKLHNVLLEEIEHDEAHSRWLVTIGFDRPFRKPPAMSGGGVSQAIIAMQGGPQYERAFKLVMVDGNTGKVLKMVDGGLED